MNRFKYYDCPVDYTHCLNCLDCGNPANSCNVWRAEYEATENMKNEQRGKKLLGKSGCAHYQARRKSEKACLRRTMKSARNDNSNHKRLYRQNIYARAWQRAWTLEYEAKRYEDRKKFNDRYIRGLESAIL